MLTIKNIERIRGMMSLGYEIKKITTKDKILRGDYYIFSFDKDFQDLEVRVYLNRHSESKDGLYDMFVMGWGASTRVYVQTNDLCNPCETASQIRRCLRLLEEKCK